MKNEPKNSVSSLGKLIKIELIKRNKTQNWLISELKKRLPTMYIDSSALNKILTGKVVSGKIVDEIHSILNI